MSAGNGNGQDAGRVVTLADLARRLGVNRRTVKRWGRRLGVETSLIGDAGRWAVVAVRESDAERIAAKVAARESPAGAGSPVSNGQTLAGHVLGQREVVSKNSTECPRTIVLHRDALAVLERIVAALERQAVRESAAEPRPSRWTRVARAVRWTVEVAALAAMFALEVDAG
jgi:hypothetical protein